MISALHLLHSRTPSIVHRDISPDNIMIVDFDLNTIHAVLSDFDVSREIHGTNIHTKTGKDYYCAPEVALEGNYGTKMDIWSLGVVLYAMMTRSVQNTQPTKIRSDQQENEIHRGMRQVIKVCHKESVFDLVDVDVHAVWRSLD
jgi:serine/threonine protein kinase